MILVVDDNSFVRRFILRALRPVGYDIFDAASGEEAIEACKEQQGEIDLLLIDIVMPGLNGVEVAGILKSMQEEIKVIYMSGYTEDILKDQGILLSGDCLITKPVQINELRERVRDALVG